MRRIIVLVCVAGLLVGAHSSTNSRRLELIDPYGSGGGFGVTATDTASGAVRTFGAGALCLNRPGVVTVERVEFASAVNGLTVSAFAVRPNPAPGGGGWLGSSRRSLREQGLDPSARQLVDRRCPEIERSDEVVLDAAEPVEPAPPKTGPGVGFYELGIQVTKTGDTSQEGVGVVVHYRTALGRDRFVIPMTVTLCSPGDTSLENCSDPP